MRDPAQAQMRLAHAKGCARVRASLTVCCRWIRMSVSVIASCGRGCKAVNAIPATAEVTASVGLASVAPREPRPRNPRHWGLVQVARLSMGAIRHHDMAGPSASVDSGERRGGQGQGSQSVSHKPRACLVWLGSPNLVKPLNRAVDSTIFESAWVPQALVHPSSRSRPNNSVQLRKK